MGHVNQHWLDDVCQGVPLPLSLTERLGKGEQHFKYSFSCCEPRGEALGKLQGYFTHSSMQK